MKHLAHLVWFDLKAAKNLIVVWGGVILAQTVVLAIGPEPPDPASPISGVAADLGAMIVRFGIAVAFAAIIIQHDVLVGSTAFWRTRPASRAAMMASKLVSVTAVLVLLPAAIMCVFLLLAGMRPVDALGGAMGVAAEQLIVVGLSLPLAVVTSSLAEFAIAAVCAVFSMMILMRVAVPALFDSWPALAFRMGISQMAAQFSVLLAGAAAVVANQYLTMRTWRSIAAIAASVVLASYAYSLPGTVSVASTRQVIERNVEGLERASIHVNPATILATPMYAGGGTDRSQVVIRVSGVWDTSGAPDSIILEPASVESRFSAGGRDVRASIGGLMGRMSFDEIGSTDGQPYRSVRGALGVETLLPVRRQGVTFRAALGEFPADITGADGVVVSTFDANVRMRALRYVVRDAIRIETGAGSAARSRHLTVVNVSPSQGGFAIDLRAVSIERPRRTLLPGYWVLRNAARRQAVFAPGELTRRYAGTTGIGGSRVIVDAIRIEVTIPFADAKSGISDADWLKGADLVWLEAENAGTVTLPLHMDEFQLYPKLATK